MPPGPPARLVGGDDARVAHPCDQAPVGGQGRPGGPVQEADDPPGVTQMPSSPKSLAILVADSPHSLFSTTAWAAASGPEVAAGGTLGRRGLVGVAPPYRRPAAWAAASLEREAAVVHGQAGQLLLADVLGPLVDGLGSATGTVPREGHGHRLVDVVGDLPVSPGAVGEPRPAAGASRMRGVVVLGERGRTGGGASPPSGQPQHLVAQRLVVATQPDELCGCPGVLTIELTERRIQSVPLELQRRHDPGQPGSPTASIGLSRTTGLVTGSASRLEKQSWPPRYLRSVTSLMIRRPVALPIRSSSFSTAVSLNTNS